MRHRSLRQVGPKIEQKTEGQNEECRREGIADLKFRSLRWDGKMGGWINSGVFKGFLWVFDGE